MNQGETAVFLRLRVQEHSSHVTVDMNQYVKECVEWYKNNVENKLSGAVTPHTADLFENGDSEIASDKAQKLFHSGIARLLFYATRLGGDILVAVNHLASKVGKCNVGDLKKLQRIYGYLANAGERQFKLMRNNGTLTIEAYIDASYGVHDKGLSRGGVVVLLNGVPVCIKSSKQKVVARSSTEAELIALSDLSGEAIWLKRLLEAQGYEVGTVRIFQDNKSVLALIKKRNFRGRTKHLDTKYFGICELIKEGIISVEYCDTRNMLADLLTKPLIGEQFRKLKTRLLGPSLENPNQVGGVLAETGT
jgi:hypothetical protein